MTDTTKLDELRQRTRDMMERVQAEKERSLSGPDKWNEEAWVDAIAEDIAIAVMRYLPREVQMGSSRSVDDDISKYRELARSAINHIRKPAGSA